MGEPATQPIRVYAPLQAATTPEERADLLLAEIDRTGALERPAFALFSPTGSGYVNYVATETFEYLTRGNCASASIQYSVLPSALSLTKVDYATHQTRILVNGIVARLMAMPAEKRPKFYLFGESLGSQVSEEMFRGTGTSGPVGHRPRRGLLDRHAGVDGVPAGDVGHAHGVRAAGGRSGRRSTCRARSATGTPCRQEEKDTVDFLLLQNGDDPMPKFARTARVEATRLARTRRTPARPARRCGTRWLPGGHASSRPSSTCRTPSSRLPASSRRADTTTGSSSRTRFARCSASRRAASR